MNEFDFIKAFGDVSLLQTEAIGKIMASVVSAFYRGMVDAGVPEEAAHRIVKDAYAAMFSSLLGMSR